MGPMSDTGFGFRLQETEGGWTWVTFDTAGRAQDGGRAPDKAVAAACVVRALARAAARDEGLRAA